MTHVIKLTEPAEEKELFGVTYLREANAKVDISSIEPSEDGSYRVNYRFSVNVGNTVVDKILLLKEHNGQKIKLDGQSLLVNVLKSKLGLKDKLTLKDFAEGVDIHIYALLRRGIDIVIKDATLFIESIQRKNSSVKKYTLMLYDTPERKSKISIVKPFARPEEIFPAKIKTDVGEVEVNSLAEIFMYLTNTMPENKKELLNTFSYEFTLNNIRFAWIMVPLVHVALFAPPGTGKTYSYKAISNLAAIIAGSSLTPAAAVVDARHVPPKPGIFAIAPRVFVDEFPKLLRLLNRQEYADFVSILMTRLSTGILARRDYRFINHASTMRVGINKELVSALDNEIRKSLYEQFVDRFAIIAHIRNRKIPKRAKKRFMRQKVIDLVHLKKIISTYRLTQDGLIRSLLFEHIGYFEQLERSSRKQMALERFALAVACFNNISFNKAINAVKGMLDIMDDRYTLHNPSIAEVYIDDPVIYEKFAEDVIGDIYG